MSTRDYGGLPSVTEILRATAPRAYGLERWRASLGEHAEAVVEIARQRGNKLDRDVVAFMSGEDVAPCGWFASIRPFVALVRQASQSWTMQQALTNDFDGYGGTPDLTTIAGNLSFRPGSCAIYDWKTSAERVKGPKLEDYKAQLGGYADLVAYATGTRPTEGFVVVAICDKPSQIVPVDLEAAAAVWRERLAAYKELYEANSTA